MKALPPASGPGIPLDHWVLLYVAGWTDGATGVTRTVPSELSDIYASGQEAGRKAKVQAGLEARKRYVLLT